VSTSRSLWIESTQETSYAALGDDVEVDVAVVGAGIVGITAALLLKQAGKTVAVVEAKRILHGATGNTTAKVAAAHSTVYTNVEEKFGAAGARVYAAAQQGALDLISRLVAEESIDCDFERKTNYVYCETRAERSRIEQEVAAARRAGLAARLVEETPLPYAVECAAALDDQAQFHPRKYLLPLAQRIHGDGSHILELTRVVDVCDGTPLRVETDRGTMTARDVIVASGLPILDRGFFFAKAHPERSYAVAARIAPADDPDGMYINIGSPTRSIRTARDEQGLLLLVGGEGHRPGDGSDTEARYSALENFALRHWNPTGFLYRWSTQDYMSVDGVPYVGRLSRRSDHIYAATGFRKWGMTNGTAAAMILSDAILGRANAWADLFDSKRLKPVASARKLVTENAKVAKHFVGDRVKRGSAVGVDAVARGEGRLISLGGRKTAAYRDEAGALHALSPRCTHLGCHVNWNNAERSWDCPCHGSRFSGDGHVIQGPATRDLERRAVGAE